MNMNAEHVAIEVVDLLVEQRTRQLETLKDRNIVTPFLDLLPSLIVILNSQREIVYANRAFLLELGLADVSGVSGKRLGDVLDCIHASECDLGCGKTLSCKYCGASNAILTGKQGRPSVEECRIIKKDSNEALDFRIWESPIHIGKEQFVALTIRDISDEKRRQALERVFLHDILDMTGGLKGFVELLKDSDDSEKEELGESVYHIADSIVDEILAQKELIAAEEGQLQTAPDAFQSTDILEDVQHRYLNHFIAENKTIEIDLSSDDVEVYSDYDLVRRVVGNMLKNALEAVRAGDVVRIGCKQVDDQIVYQVWNKSVIPQDVQLQIFQRSFSTKGLGRGLGTHSMRLLARRFLSGDVSFISTEEAGTTFYVRIPMTLNK